MSLNELIVPVIGAFITELNMPIDKTVLYYVVTEVAKKQYDGLTSFIAELRVSIPSTAQLPPQ